MERIVLLKPSTVAGFVKKSVAPALMQNSFSDLDEEVVRIAMGMCLNSSDNLIRLKTSRPCILGRFKSKRITLGKFLHALRKGITLSPCFTTSMVKFIPLS